MDELISLEDLLCMDGTVERCRGCHRLVDIWNAHAVSIDVPEDTGYLCGDCYEDEAFR